MEEEWISKEAAMGATGLSYSGLYVYVRRGVLRTRTLYLGRGHGGVKVEYAAEDVQHLVVEREKRRPCAFKDCLNTVVGARRFCSDRCMYAARYQRKRDEISAYHKSRREDPEFRKRKHERAKKWVEDNPSEASNHYHRSQMKLRYGITPEEYEALAAKNGGRCWICNKEQKETTASGEKRRLVVDHDHAHDKGDSAGVRGVLCTACNVHLVAFEDREWNTAGLSYLAARGAFELPPATPGDKRAAIGGSYGLVESQYAWLIERCGGACEICSAKPAGKGNDRLNVDHDHAKKRGEAGYIRGMLCSRCNTRIGKLEHATYRPAAEQYLATAPAIAQQIINDLRAGSR